MREILMGEDSNLIRILPECLSDLSQHKTFANPKRLRFRVEAIRLNQCVLIDNEHPCKYDHDITARN